ncbi:MAG: tetratricopeptide repeat protein, partial [Magnetococcales bacterium]|nr:tetratricopeptide repeat protein [Magnetococcales bacterium]
MVRFNWSSLLGKKPSSAEEATRQFQQSVTALQQGDDELAWRHCQQALDQDDRQPEIWVMAGILHFRANQMDQASHCYRKATALNPQHADAWYNLAVLMQQQHRDGEAMRYFLETVRLQPDCIDGWYNLGILMQQQQRYQEASHYFHQVVERHPDDASVWYNLAVLAQEQQYYDEAIRHYHQAATLRPNDAAALIGLIHTQQKLCDWSAFGQLRQLLIQPALSWREDSNLPPPEPFPFLSLPGITAAEQQQIARSQSLYKQREIQTLPADDRYHRSAGGGNRPLRLGYLSSDFGNHPVAHQMLGVFKRHNRSRFEIFAYSLDSDDGSSYRQRIEQDVDHFIDIRLLNDQEAAQRIRDDQIDLLVDLNGHTRGNRLPILARRPAPIQLSWMGYLGTMGTDCIDYVVTDRWVTPMEQQSCYHEQFLYMPHTFLVSDREQAVAELTGGKSSHGLPEHGFVLCCFNAHYKIGPEIFAVWMALLHALPGSVLWLMDGPGRTNLQQSAMKQGIAAERLVFSPWLPKEQYLALYRWADLFLDTPYYNAGATASGALWMGVPLLTCPGQTFTARVGLSLLHAIGLDQEGLIVDSLEQYRARALELATHPEELNRIRQKLQANRLTQPLFDTDRFVRDLESILEQVWRSEATSYQVTSPAAASHRNQAIHQLQQALAAYKNGSYDTAWNHCQQALKLDETLSDGWTVAGLLHDAAQRIPEAMAAYQRAIDLKPSCADPYHNLGNLFHQQNQVEQAIGCYQQALQRQPDCVAAHYNMGLLMQKQQHDSEAIRCYRQALDLQPDHADAWYNLGLLLQQDHPDQAAHHYQRAMALKPDHADSWYNLGLILQQQNLLEEAIRHHQQAIRLKPDHVPAIACLIQSQQNMCDWRSFKQLRQLLIEPALAWHEGLDTPPPEPFQFLSIPEMTESEQRQIASNCSRYKQAGIQPLMIDRRGQFTHSDQRRLRLGYLSSDFRNHAVAHQTIGIFKRHNRQRFEVWAYSSGPDDGSRYRRQIEQEVDHFVDLRQVRDQQAAQRIQQDGIDILIDLNGHTAGARLALLAYRPAPVQMTWMGYLGTIGSDAIDYMITDRWVTPADQPSCYNEKLLYMPHSFQVTDGDQEAGATVSSRAEHGLPEQGFVFCCFNNHYKITPELFDVWMALLRQIPDSVLWLTEGPGRANLQRMAAEQNVLPTRLIFNPPLSKPDYLARYRHADLFLDTLRYNAGATASGALWMGVPVLTCPGQSFAARVGLSLLHAIGLEHEGLIVDSLEHYQARALELATHPEQLQLIRQKLQANRLTHPLFDTDRFVRDLESILEQVWRTEAAQYTVTHPAADSRHDRNQAIHQLQHALAAYQKGSHDTAWNHCQQALQWDETLSDGWTVAGLLHEAAQRIPEAMAAYRRAIDLKPSCADPYHNLASLLHQQNQVQEALACYQQAIQQQPDCVAAHYNKALLQQQQHHDTEAIQSYRQVIALQPDHADAWYNLGLILQQQNLLEQAAHHYQQALQQRPDYAQAHLNLGVLAGQQQRHDEAIRHYRKAVELQSDYADAWYNLGLLLQQRNNLDHDALHCYRQVIALRPDYAAAAAELVRSEQMICDWRSFDSLGQNLRQRMIEPALNWQDGHHTPPPAPFWFLAIPNITEAEQLIIARAYSRYQQRSIQPLPADNSHRPVHRGSRRLRVGYLSSDFRNHAVAHQMLSVFRRHDRQRFEILAYSIGPDDGSVYRRRIEQDVDYFIDLMALNDQQAAQRIRDDGIDVLIDLNGYTGGARSQILAYRPAPVQLSWLGYLGTMGTDCIDFIITDRWVTPEQQQSCYQEKFLYMPHSFLISDGEQEVADTTGNRTSHGLPEQGFVFCCFNTHYKIGPTIFAIWMVLLRELPGSVLWLMDGPGRTNLQQAAVEQDITVERLVFSPRLPKEQYLALYRWADLLLDTPYYNAGATASGALWMGVPLLTCPGQTFAARVGLSLLHAIGLENEGLIVDSLEHYQARALELATHPEQLQHIRQKLQANRLTYPLFDTD